MARLVAMVEATVTYACYLSERDSELVRACAEAEECSLDVAVMILYNEGVINLYHNSVESDFSTNECTQVEEKGAD